MYLIGYAWMFCAAMGEGEGEGRGGGRSPISYWMCPMCPIFRCCVYEVMWIGHPFLAGCVRCV